MRDSVAQYANSSLNFFLLLGAQLVRQDASFRCEIMATGSKLWQSMLSVGCTRHASVAPCMTREPITRTHNATELLDMHESVVLVLHVEVNTIHIRFVDKPSFIDHAFGNKLFPGIGPCMFIEIFLVENTGYSCLSIFLCEVFFYAGVNQSNVV